MLTVLPVSSHDIYIFYFDGSPWLALTASYSALAEVAVVPGRAQRQLFL